MQIDDNVIIKYKFTRKTKNGDYTDSIDFTPQEFEALNESDLEGMIQARISAFESIVATEIDYEQELLDQKQRLQSYLADIESQILQV